MMATLDYDLLPTHNMAEIAFIGRSNVGKSSLINRLLQQDVARVSQTPGRTQKSFCFHVPSYPCVVVDLPGYGFAKAPKHDIDAWNDFIHQYMAHRQNLTMVMLLIDSRHPLKEIDEAFMQFLTDVAQPFQLVFTKADKAKKSQLETLKKQCEQRRGFHPTMKEGILVTSAKEKNGMRDLRQAIASLANLAKRR